jgi:hypothetical protein
MCAWGLEQNISTNVIGVPDNAFDVPVVPIEPEDEDWYKDDDRIVHWDEEE